MKKSRTGASLAKRLSAIVLIMVVSSTAIVGAFSYVLHRGDSIELSAEKALAIAQSVAASINPAEFTEMLATNTKTQHWYDIKAAIDNIKTNTNVMYLYILDKNYGDNVKYFAEASYDNESDSLDLGAEESIDVHADELFESLKTGLPSTTEIYSADEYGMMLSGFAPIFDNDNNVIGIVGVDLSIDEVTKASDNFGIQIIASVLAFSAVFWLISRWYINRNIGKPIGILSQASRRFAEGDMEIDLEVHSNDEIGRLTTSFQNMADSTRKQIEILENLANGDLTMEISPRSDRDSMGFAMKKMLDNLNIMFEEINSSTEHVSTGAGQIANAAQILAQGSAEQAATVEQLGGFITQMSDKAKENAAMAGKAASLANTIKGNAEKGSHQMERMMQAVKEINEASQSISKVIKVIDDIAFQTNILALNAAVEAARAGQHGKGFSVVADEVRSLASKSSEAAKDTGSLIINSIEKAELGAQIASETSDSLSEIVSGINESSRIMLGIAGYSEDQGVSIAKISDDIGQVSQIVQQNSATAEESAASSEELSSQSTILRKLISRFKLKNINNSYASLSGTPRGSTAFSYTAPTYDNREKY